MWLSILPLLLTYIFSSNLLGGGGGGGYKLVLEP
ncbi:unnamed protein product [Spirodela intermedia]|uniref:Uncharacterized protein n=1 Tax=Spirodela intermedia TaxID=51605 RepID=A0A7I8L5A4_SPIIN|nr:unnamed protein product [Spirodela intermedia]